MTQDAQTEDERVRGYLLAQAARNDLVTLWPRVMSDRTAFLLAFDRVSEEQARWRSAETDGWSIHEVARHMLLWTRSTTDVIEALAAGGTAEAPGLGALDPRDVSIAEARLELTREAARFASLLDRLPREPDLAAEAYHERFGALNHRGWFLFARLHDGDHRAQIEAIKAAEGYPAAS